MKIKLNILNSLLFLLILPNIIFLIFWYQWLISFPIISLITFLIYKSDIEYVSLLNKSSIKVIFLTIIISIYLAILSGTCNIMPQTFDFIKHNLITCDLVKYKWPVIYDDKYYLSYNIAYYLIPSGLSKLFSSSIAEYLTFIQLVIIIFLALRYIQNYVTKNPYHSFLLILLPNSIFLLRILFISVGFNKFFDLNNLSFLSPDYLFEKPFYLEISTFTTQIVYVPQHFSALLISGCLMHHSWTTKNIKMGALLCCFTPLWSVFTALAFLLLLFFQMIIYHRKVLLHWGYLLLSTIVYGVIVSYFNGHSRPGFIRFWNMTLSEIQEIVLFLICVLLPYLTFLFFIKLSRKKYFKNLKKLINEKKTELLLPLISFSLVPFFFIFYQFDFMLRGGATFLFFLNLFVLSHLNKLKPFYLYLFLFVFSIGGFLQLTIKPINEVITNADKYPFKDYKYYLINNKTIYDLDGYHQKDIKFQYLSVSNKSIYYKFFAPKKQLISLTNQPPQ